MAPAGAPETNIECAVPSYVKVPLLKVTPVIVALSIIKFTFSVAAK